MSQNGILPNTPATIIVSGGIDSTTLLHDVSLTTDGNSLKSLIFRYGQKHSKEVYSALRNSAELGVPSQVIDLEPVFTQIVQGSSLINDDVEVPSIDEVMGDPQPVTYVPFRNLIFLSVALSAAESFGHEVVYYGAQKHDQYGYWDTTPDFVLRLRLLAGLNRKHPIQVRAPYINMKKSEIIQRGTALGVDYAETWSCYKGDHYPCLTCPTCSERLKGFEEAGLIDPLVAEMEL